MQVIFVDDEPRVLTGIERALAMQDKDWACRFATSGKEALALLEETPADVVVSDMRMPFMDGAELLTQVRERWPASIRIILSGHSDTDATLRMLDVAHQFVFKPCDNAALLAVLEDALSLRKLFRDPQVTDVVGRISRLPAAPKVFAEICRLLADPASDAHQIAERIGSDPALGAKILQLANSAFFSRGVKIHDISNAIARLGLDQVSLLVLASQVFAEAADDPQIALLQRRAMLAASLATRIAGKKGIEATAALLAHVALIVPELRQAEADTAATACDTPMHAAVGAYLLAVWGLPFDIVEAVARHHRPARAGAPTVFDTAGIVHVATALASGEAPDQDYLQQAGVLDKLPEWERLCARMEESDE
jgi:HD-like signal output (HDOD) protein/CheY-like chemotaxis protein